MLGLIFFIIFHVRNFFGGDVAEIQNVNNLANYDFLNRNFDKKNKLLASFFYDSEINFASPNFSSECIAFT